LSDAQDWATTLPEFDVTLTTVRSGTRIIRVAADDAGSACELVRAECRQDLHHCPPDWCVDDVQTEVASVREVVLEGVVLITADAIGTGTLYADDSLRMTSTSPGA
jgi:hypothetical protein